MDSKWLKGAYSLLKIQDNKPQQGEKYMGMLKCIDKTITIQRGYCVSRVSKFITGKLVFKYRFAANTHSHDTYIVFFFHLFERTSYIKTDV